MRQKQRTTRAPNRVSEAGWVVDYMETTKEIIKVDKKKMSFEERLEKGKKFENKIFQVFQKYNEIPHSSDKVVWIKGKPIWIETKSGTTIEWKSWLDQIKISRLGFKVIIVAKDKYQIRADWIENIRIEPKKKGARGSFNDWTILHIRKDLQDLLKEL